MRLITRCKNCLEEIKVNIPVNDRAELAHKKGDNFSIQCHECRQSRSYHVNDIKATGRKALSIVALLIFAVGTIVIAYLLRNYLLSADAISCYAFLLVPSVIYVLLKREEQRSITLFNRYFV